MKVYFASLQKKEGESMKKILKDVFNNIVLDSPILETTVEEVKFSKKLNSAIIRITSEKAISLKTIEQFEKEAAKCYELNHLKIDYRYVGQPVNVTETHVKEIMDEVRSVFNYTQDILKDASYSVQGNNIVISLVRPFSQFLKIKKIDRYISNNLLQKFGKELLVEFVDLNKVEITAPKAVHVEDMVQSQPNFNAQPMSTPSFSKEGFKQPYAKREPKPKFEENAPDYVVIGKDISSELTDKIIKINAEYDRACIEGEICESEARKLKSGKYIFTIDVTDKTSTVACKMFLEQQEVDKIAGKLKKGECIKLLGKPQFDPYAKDVVIMINSIVQIDKPTPRKDNAEKKRVELHMHTQMSAMDGVSSATDIVKQAIKWGHPAVAITDHGVAQSFPEAHQAIMKAFGNLGKPNEEGQILTQQILNDAPTKVIYGVEGYLTCDIEPDPTFSDTFCVFDIETTGFNNVFDKITEIAVVKLKNGQVIGEYSTFVNPERGIPEKVQELTHITQEMVKNAPKISQVLPEFLEFVQDSILVAHNARFDIRFIKENCKNNGLTLNNKVLDTLTMARELYETFENHKLGTLAEKLEIELEGAHRAINDTRATAKIFLRMQQDSKKKGIGEYGYVYSELSEEAKKLKYHHIILLVKDYVGLKNLYKLISFSHIHHFYKKPIIPRSLLNRYREGIILGSACEQGELYQSIMNQKTEQEIQDIAKFYDYLEIQPLGNNNFYIQQGKATEQSLIEVNKKIVDLGEKLQLPVVATCDVHFLNKEDEIYRRIIMAGQGYSDADKQAPLYFRTTEEMKQEFSYLDQDKIEEIVVTNPNEIASRCQPIQPVVDGTYPPTIEGSEEYITNLSYETAKSIYGDPLPNIVVERLEKELKPIIKYGFAVMYMIAMKLVKKSNADGYLVGSRGSVGSSFVATMTGITEVNPLPPHYVCKQCKYSEFPKTTVTTGIDMENKDCPHCHITMIKNGMDIPFETFLGFKGDKAPDIDLNFSGDNQASAHAYTEVLFGKSKTFRAGTIGTVADKTAYGFVRKYLDERNLQWRNPEINRVSKGCTGIKRTTGQHPGGIIVVPADKEIYDFCPIQKPADDPTAKSITTHFDFHSIHDNLLKLDILGHDDPTVIRMLEDLTGVDAKTIPLDEPKVMSLFSGTEALGVTSEQINSETGTYAVPEFGTKFVRGMLLDTRPTTFGELVRISGLSHGTDVWLGNAQTIIEEKIATLREAICTRDDIMIYLMQMGVEPQISFKTMESVRKGKGLTPDMEQAMREKDVPEWYIDSCKKIKYMFPKAHAAAYVMMAYRIAYFKVYYPKEFYATYMTVRASNVNYEMMMYGKEIAKQSIITLENKQDASNTEKDTITVLEVVNEMYERGISFLPVDIYISDVKKYLIESDGIRPPLSALTGFGEVDAQKLVEARKEGIFDSMEDLQIKAKLGKVSMETLEKYGCLKNMPKSAQINFLDM